MARARNAPDMAKASWKYMSASEGLGDWFTCVQTQPRRRAAWEDLVWRNLGRAEGAEAETDVDIAM